jgi:hypothetical protein
MNAKITPKKWDKENGFFFKLKKSKPMLQNLPPNMMLQAFFVELHILGFTHYESIFELCQLLFTSLQCITSM